MVVGVLVLLSVCFYMHSKSYVLGGPAPFTFSFIRSYFIFFEVCKAGGCPFSHFVAWWVIGFGGCPSPSLCRGPFVVNLVINE